MNSRMNSASRTSPQDDDDSTPLDIELRGARVLVADDDAAMRNLVVSRLVLQGYRVDEAISGTDLVQTLTSIAVDAWPLDGVDLMVLDLRMPGLTGLEVIRRMRAARWAGPVILMTAFPADDVYAEAQGLGVRVLAKPFPLAHLLETAASLLVEHLADRDDAPRSWWRV